MLRILLVLRQKDSQPELCRELERRGMACTALAAEDLDGEPLGGLRPDVLLLEIDRQPLEPDEAGLIGAARKKKIPVMALVPAEVLTGLDGGFEAGDDFITGSYRADELFLRISRLLQRAGKKESGERIERNGLVINLSNCEVTVNGRVAELTYKEYELLKLLAGSPGRVYTRDTLLNKVWGYDYFGGDRTVDVHIRRLRSKIEGPGPAFIETVRNIGYRFRKEGSR
jgi:two-component system alkaline phosphatase synthesis response regulator PhoP